MTIGDYGKLVEIVAVVVSSTGTRSYLANSNKICPVSDTPDVLHPAWRLPLELVGELHRLRAEAEKHSSDHDCGLTGDISGFLLVHSGPPSKKIAAYFKFICENELRWNEQGITTVVKPRLDLVMDQYAESKSCIAINLGVTSGVAVQDRYGNKHHRSHTAPGLIRGGGGYELGLSVLRSAMDEMWGKLQISDVLKDLLLDDETPTIEDLIDWAEVLEPRSRKPRISALAEAVCRAADQSDAHAIELINKNAIRVSDLVNDAIKEILVNERDAFETPVPVYFLGGLLRYSSIMRDTLTTSLNGNVGFPLLPPTYEEITTESIMRMCRNPSI